MPFHVLAYQNNFAGAANDQTATRVADPSFDDNGTSFRFTENWDLIAALLIGATATRARINAPSLNNVVQHQITHINRALTIQDQAVPEDYRSSPYHLPQNEPVAVQSSNSGIEQNQILLWITSPDFRPSYGDVPDPMNLFKTSPILCARFTITPTSVANAFVNDGAITFETAPRGGWYDVLGMDAIRANGLAARLNFRRGPQYNGRRLRPGCLCRQSLDTRPDPYAQFTRRMGVWGTFHTQEQPTFDIFANDAAATAIEGRMFIRLRSLAGQGNPPISGAF